MRCIVAGNSIFGERHSFCSKFSCLLFLSFGQSQVSFNLIVGFVLLAVFDALIASLSTALLQKDFFFTPPVDSTLPTASAPSG